MADPPQKFTYISRAKVEALEPQVKRGPSSLSGSLTVRLPVGEVIVSGGGKKADDLVARTVALNRKLRKRPDLKALAEETEIDFSSYYADQETWWHGLYAFEGDISLEQGGARVVSYLAWRPWRDSIVLLAGSPENVLGEHIATGSLKAYGTTGTWASIMNFAETTFQTDEPSFVETRDSATEAGGPTGEPVPGALFDSPRGLALSVICARYLSGLPRNRIDTVFSLSERFPIRPGPLPAWVVDALADGAAGESRLEFVRRCEAVYIGSPLYTAVV